MDWPRKSPEIHHQDRKVFQYSALSSTIVKLYMNGTVRDSNYVFSNYTS